MTKALQGMAPGSSMSEVVVTGYGNAKEKISV